MNGLLWLIVHLLNYDLSTIRYSLAKILLRQALERASGALRLKRAAAQESTKARTICLASSMSAARFSVGTRSSSPNRVEGVRHVLLPASDDDSPRLPRHGMSCSMEAMENYRLETNNEELPTTALWEWLAEWAPGTTGDNWRQQHGLLLTSAHRVPRAWSSTTWWPSWAATGTPSDVGRTRMLPGVCTTSP